MARYSSPTEGPKGEAIVRNDSGVREGDEISMFYDPMIAKLSTWAPTRLAAIDAMSLALEDLHVEGLRHNAAFLSAVMEQERFRTGALSTSYIADEFPDGFNGLIPTERQHDIFTVSALAMHLMLAGRARAAGGSREPIRRDWIVMIGRRKRPVTVSHEGGALRAVLTDENRTLELSGVKWRPGKHLFHAELDGQGFSANVSTAAEGFVIRHRAAQAKLLFLTPVSADLHERLPVRPPVDTSRIIASPMPGLMVSIAVAVGQEVKEGEQICVIEAMKMQNIIRAERDGVVKSVGFKAGDSVSADDVLVELA